MEDAQKKPETDVPSPASEDAECDTTPVKDAETNVLAADVHTASKDVENIPTSESGDCSRGTTVLATSSEYYVPEENQFTEKWKSFWSSAEEKIATYRTACKEYDSMVTDTSVETLSEKLSEVSRFVEGTKKLLEAQKQMNDAFQSINNMAKDVLAESYKICSPDIKVTDPEGVTTEVANSENQSTGQDAEPADKQANADKITENKADSKDKAEQVTDPNKTTNEQQTSSASQVQTDVKQMLGNAPDLKLFTQSENVSTDSTEQVAEKANAKEETKQAPTETTDRKNATPVAEQVSTDSNKQVAEKATESKDTPAAEEVSADSTKQAAEKAESKDTPAAEEVSADSTKQAAEKDSPHGEKVSTDLEQVAKK